MVFVTILIYAALAIYEFLPLYYEKKSKELIVNGVLFIFSFIAAILIFAGIVIPSPAGPIKSLITSVFGR